MKPNSMQTLQLHDGRKLAFEEQGNSNGFPVVFFHGTPNSRCFRHPNDEIAIQRGVRVIRFDRPGFGHSDPHPGHTLLQGAEDVVELADALQLGRFTVAGISGGAPHALACAWLMPKRVTAAALISALAPLEMPRATAGMNKTNRLGLWIARYLPFLLPLALTAMAKSAAKDPQGTLEQAATDYAEPDQLIMKRPEVQEMYIEDIREAYRQGVRGHADDLKRMARPWGFKLEEIQVPVTLWQGQLDQNVPRAMAQYMADRIPQSELKLIPHEGHLLMFDYWDEILTQLVKEGAAAMSYPKL